MVGTHRSTRASRVFSACLLASLSSQGLLSMPAVADDDANAAETAAARTMAVEGMKLADAGKCGEALDKLVRAERLHHSIIVLGRLAECFVAQGKIVDGTEALRRALRETLPPNASPAMLKARERAQTALDAARPRIAILTISVKGPSDNSVTVTVDGQPVSSVLLDGDRPTDPGEHLVEASATGFIKASSRIRILPGEKQSVALELDAEPAAPAEAAAAHGTPAPAGSLSRVSGAATSAAPSESGTSNKTGSGNRGAYVSWAAGGAVLLVGTGFGALAYKDKMDLDKVCKSNVCPASAQDRLKSANTLATISTVLVGAGAAGLVLGTIWFASAKSSSTGDVRSPTVAQTGPRAWIGVGQAGFATDF